MQRPHEWKADMLTLRDLAIQGQRHVRMPKRKTDVRIKNGIGYHQKSAEVILSRKRASPERGGLTKDEGLNVRMAK
jgi:hypothetical protein